MYVNIRRARGGVTRAAANLKTVKKELFLGTIAFIIANWQKEG